MAKQAKPIAVIATRDGHYGGKYRTAGDKFEVTDPKHVSSRWMAPQNSQKAKDFEKALDKRGQDRDSITGERVSAGGVPEQLAVALEENRKLTDQVASQQQAIDELTKQLQELKSGPVASVTPADPSEGASGEEEDAVDSTGTGEKKPQRRRRKAQPEE
jgi:hypothetical protein